MPFSKRANHLFRAVSHGWTPPASSGIDIAPKDAKRMAHEGIKDEPEAKDSPAEDAREHGQRKALRKMRKA